MTSPDQPSVHHLGDDPRVELAAGRTALSFERTLQAADRTLMAAVRTALSLITFGFTIVQLFHRYMLARGPHAEAIETTGRRFGLTLLLFGVGLLVVSLISHYRTMVDLRRRRDQLHGQGLLRSAAQVRPTPTGVLALLLLLAGLAAIFGILVHTGPFAN
jgi:putative membrane protein